MSGDRPAGGPLARLPTATERAAIERQIAGRLTALREPLRAKDWQPLVDYAESAALYVKGRRLRLRELELLVKQLGRSIRDPRVIVEEVLGRTIGWTRAQLDFRVALVGVRANGVDRDGIVVDARLVLVLRGGEWRLESLSVDCPPEWARWNNRPNPQAPVDYGDRRNWRPGVAPTDCSW